MKEMTKKYEQLKCQENTESIEVGKEKSTLGFPEYKWAKIS